MNGWVFFIFILPISNVENCQILVYDIEKMYWRIINNDYLFF